MTNANRPSGSREDVHAEVASALWRERELLERVLFALTCQQLVLSSGEIRWLTMADAQVQDAVAAMTDCELRRALVTHDLTVLLGLPGDATLDTIATAADVPWDALLAEHRDALRTLAAEIGLVTAENRRLLQAGAELARESMALVGESSSPFPGAASGPVGPMLFDRQV